MAVCDSLAPSIREEDIMAALEIRKDRTPTALRKLAREVDDARIVRRLLAIANALDGMTREDAARAVGMDRQALRDAVVRYNTDGVEGLADRWNGGRPPTFTPQEQAEIVEIVLAGPDVEATGLSTYTLEDLADLCEERFGKRLHPWSFGRMLKNLGLSRQKARPLHPETDPAAQAVFKKTRTSAARDPSTDKKARATVLPGRGADRPEGPDGPRVVATR